MRPRTTTLLALSLLALSAVGCGDSPTPGPSADDAAVRQTMRTYLTALADGNGDQACAQLTAPAKRQVVTQMAAIISERGATTCTEVLGSAARKMPDVMRDQFSVAKIDVRRHGDSATAGAPGYEANHAQLRRIDGRWLISSFPLGSGAP